MNCIFFRWQSKEVSALRSAFAFWHSVKGADTTLATLPSHSGASRTPSASARGSNIIRISWAVGTCPLNLLRSQSCWTGVNGDFLPRCAGFRSRCRPHSSTSCCCILCQRHLCRSVLVCRGCLCGRSRFSDKVVSL